MLKKLIILLFVACPLATFAQTKIAYIDAQALMQVMPEYKAAQTQMDAKNKEVQTNLAAMETEYNTKMKEFSQDSTKVTQSILEDRQKQVQAIQERYQAYTESSQKEIQALNQTLMAPIAQKLKKAIQEVGADQKFTYIIEQGAALYIAPDAVDAGKLVRTKLGISQTAMPVQAAH